MPGALSQRVHVLCRASPGLSEYAGSLAHSFIRSLVHPPGMLTEHLCVRHRARSRGHMFSVLLELTLRKGDRQ